MVYNSRSEIEKSDITNLSINLKSPRHKSHTNVDIV